MCQTENINNETSKKNSFEYKYSNKLITKFQKKYEKEKKKKLNKKKNWWKKKIKIRYHKNDILFTIFILKENNYNLNFSDFKFI